MNWDDALNVQNDCFGIRNLAILRDGVLESLGQLELGNPNFFAESLQTDQVWRIFTEFRDSTAYLDIETNGLAGSEEFITTISMFDGVSVNYYIRDYNLYQFREDVQNYKLLVTYNGKCFDLPAIERHLGVKFNHAHIDLRFVLSSLGYKGGLKGCE
ncbi:MAG: ribonuclease H-like domain-containing protein, partial [Desulfomonilaceae bacterium]